MASPQAQGGTGHTPGRAPLTDAHTKILVPGSRSMVALLGERDGFLKLAEAAFGADILVRGNEITISGDPAEVKRVELLFEELIKLLDRQENLTATSVSQTIELVKNDGPPPREVFGDVILTRRGQTLAPRTAGQKRYVDAIRSSTVTFGIGPAGTGKSYLAVALAVRALQAKEVSRIILTRPAVEAGERLGYLPGTMSEKIDPYMRPLYDALYEMSDAELLPRLMERGTVEVAPLAYMRGRTLNDSFIILDEAQNTTPEQMKMFLTRLGFGSKAVINGDITQTDLPSGHRSGLGEVIAILEGIEGISTVHLSAKDVVRHKIVQQIVEAYSAHNEALASEGGAGR